jgi:hypothetical protein
VFEEKNVSQESEILRKIGDERCPEMETLASGMATESRAAIKSSRSDGVF